MAKKKQKKKGGLRHIFNIIGIIFLLTGIIASCVIVWFAATTLIDAYNFDIENYKMDIASIIYATDSDGNHIEYEQLHSSTRRLWVDIEKIPDHVQKAAVAIEDERFYMHQGMDFKRTVGAFLGYITGRSEYGGSTITQQLVKNLTEERKASPTRKLREIFRALVLETQLEKDEILEYYLNVVYFGSSSYGIQMASHTYFDKDVSELTVAEAASIIGITQHPASFDPYISEETKANNKEKQEIVLAKMLELGYISQEEHDEAVTQELVFEASEDDVLSFTNSYFTEAMVNEIALELAEKNDLTLEQATRLVYSGGLKIYSTVNPKVQEAIEDVFEDSNNTALFPKLSGEVQPQAAMVVISPTDGSVLGLVGGIGKKTGSLLLNRAVDTYRQPGSSIKPITAYGPAVELDILSPGSVLIDEPYKSSDGWNPQNWYRGYKGAVTMRYAVEQSMNIPAIKTVEEVGISKSFDFAKNKLGLSSLDDEHDKNLSSLALGGMYNGVSVKNLTAAYGAFANKGIYTKPYTYTKVVDSKGKVLIEHKVTSERVFSEQTAYLMTSVLKSTAEGSLGSPARIPGMISAGKTGTTNDDKDRWYVGYTPYYLGGVWYGYDQPKTVPYSRTSVVAHKLWRAVMTTLHKDLKNKDFEKPSGISGATICTGSGKLATDSCPAKYEEFKRSQVPNKYCSIEHIQENPEDAVEENQADLSASPDASASPAVSAIPSSTPGTSAEANATSKPATTANPDSAPSPSATSNVD